MRSVTVSRRLSKPRHNTSSSNVLSYSEQQEKSISPHVSSDADYFGDYATVINAQGETRSRRKSRSKIRAYLYGQKNEITHIPSEDDAEVQHAFADAARDVRKRLSRKGSSIMQLPSAETSATRLSKSESQSLDPEKNAMIADQIKEKAFQDTLAAQNHVYSQVDEDKHVDSVMAPLRRKSLYTPGIATRNPSDILQKPPAPHDKMQSEVDRSYYYDPARPQDSPLSQLTALHLPEDGRSSPLNLHYTHLGKLQLGTLRVTNGTASPALQTQLPELVCRSNSLQSRVHDGHDIASEGWKSKNEDLVLAGRKGAMEQCWLPTVNSVTGETSPLDSEDGQRPSLISKNGNDDIPSASFLSDLCTPDLASAMAREYISELGTSPFLRYETSIPTVTPIGDMPFEDSRANKLQSQFLAVEIRQSITDAETRDTINATKKDAFLNLNDGLPLTENSLQHSTPSFMDSRLGNAKASVKSDSGYSSNCSLEMNPGTAFDAQQVTGSDVPGSEIVSRRPECVSGSRDMPYPFPEQRGRLSRSSSPVQARPSFDRTPPNAFSASAAEPTSSSSYTSIDAFRPSARPSSQRPARKLQKPMPHSQPLPIDLITIQGNQDLSQAQIPRIPSVISSRHTDRLRQFALLDQNCHKLQRTPADEEFSSTKVDQAPIRFPSPANAPGAAITSVSDIKDGRNEDSSPLFFGCDDGNEKSPLSFHRAKGKLGSRTPSKYQRTMIGEENCALSDIVRSPSWSDFGGGRKRKEQKRLAREEKASERRLLREGKELEKRLEKSRKTFQKQTEKDADKFQSMRSRSASRTRAKSSEQKSSQHDTRATIAELGTVTECLGQSPYDTATSMFPALSHNANNR